MAKRFIDTDLFRKPSFRKLPTAYKTLWVYVICECNHAGIWNVELDVAELRIGEEVPGDAAQVLGDMIHSFDGGKKWWVKDFIRFQYGAEMVTGNRMHLSVMRELEKHGLMDMLEDVTVVKVGTTVSAMRSRLSKKAKDVILLRDELTCQYCQEQKPMAELVVDHVRPVVKGGDNADDNLVACCVRCNGHKTDIDLADFLSRSHPFLNPTKRVYKILEGAFKPLQGAKDKDKDKDTSEKKERANEVEIIPEGFTVEHWRSIQRWFTYREQSKKKLTQMSKDDFIKKWKAKGEAATIAAIDNSIEKGYQGCFEPDATQRQNGKLTEDQERAARFAHIAALYPNDGN